MQISALFFFELAVILTAAQGVGWLARRFLGQPSVVGEMIAGVILGPSLLGRLAPGLFGPAVTPILAILLVGAAMAITAFPMLARIINERGLSGIAKVSGRRAKGSWRSIAQGSAWARTERLEADDHS